MKSYKYVVIVLILLLISIFIFFIHNYKKKNILEKPPISFFTQSNKIPIFIITHDRIKFLKQCVNSYHKYIKTPFEIVYYDSKSTYEPLLDYLKEQEMKNVKVYRSNINNHKGVLDAVKDYIKKLPSTKYAVITDPDVELDNVNGDILEYYIHLLNKYKVKGIGPMLRIDDIPDYYSKKKSVIKDHTRQFWSKTPIEITYKNKINNIQFSDIDTTFHLFSTKKIPKDFPNKNCIRCYKPYSARHLDWYINPNNMSQDQKYYSRNSKRIAHWGRKIK